MAEIKTPKSEKELASLVRGDLVNVTMAWENPTEIMIYEGLDENGKDSFLVAFGERMFSWRSHRRYLQFDDKRGVLFNHLYRDLVCYDENTKAGVFYPALNLVNKCREEERASFGGKRIKW
jgi:hypothetical protein